MIEQQKQLYGIAIFDEEIVLSDFTGQSERRYLVTPEQLAGFVRSSFVMRTYPGLVWIKSDLQHETHLFTLPAGRYTILYRPLPKGKKAAAKERKGKVREYQLQLPAIAVKATVTAGQIQGISLWGMNTGTLHRHTRLYELPLPNLNGESLCLGSTLRAAGHDIRSAVVTTIFDTPFNHHNNTVGKEQILFPAYVERHAGRCPLRTLRPLGIGVRLLEAR